MTDNATKRQSSTSVPHARSIPGVLDAKESRRQVILGIVAPMLIGQFLLAVGVLGLLEPAAPVLLAVQFISIGIFSLGWAAVQLYSARRDSSRQVETWHRST